MKTQLIRFGLLAGVLALLVPAVASAQYRNDQWGRPDYRRDRDNRYVRDSIQRLDRLAKDFEREVDRDLDHDRRVNGSRREDQINRQAHDFRNAVGDLKSAFGNGRDLSRSADEAQRVLRQADVMERAGRRQFDNYRVSSLWSQIRNELNTISDAYGYRGSIYGDRRDDVYRRGDNRNNVPWWQRIPGFPN
jgi:uncharacterized membrane protein YccC